MDKDYQVVLVYYVLRLSRRMDAFYIRIKKHAFILHKDYQDELFHPAEGLSCKISSFCIGIMNMNGFILHKDYQV